MIPFWKMHGAGNDFILIDDRSEGFPVGDTAWLQRIARRRTGVGCEGVVLIQPSTVADFRMRFINPDGQEVEMCGNAARCVARLAHDLGIAGRDASIETVAGILRAECLDNAVRVRMTDPRDWSLNGRIEVLGRDLEYHFVNTGVPHAVVEVEDLDNCDVAGLGKAMRYHGRFEPNGTNANFVTCSGPDSLRVRTYERGVETETLACGTGIVASALVAARLGRVSPPVRVTAASGDCLEVGFDLAGNEVRGPTLTGPAEHVFHGTLSYGE